MPSGVCTVTATWPATPGGALAKITVDDSARTVPGFAPNITWLALGTKYEPWISTTCPPFVEPTVGLIVVACGPTPIVAETIAVAQPHESGATSPGNQTWLQLLGSGTARIYAPHASVPPQVLE